MLSKLPTTPSEADTVIPRPPLLLGLAGLIPFWGLALLLTATPVFGVTSAQVGLALVAYGAVIVSFLGGIRWGLATTTAPRNAWGPYVMAVLPSLIAWATLGLPITEALVILGVVALVLGPVDRRLVAKGEAPGWYGRLRIILSTGAGAAMLVAAALEALRG